MLIVRMGVDGEKGTECVGSLQISEVVTCLSSPHTLAMSCITASFSTQAISPVRESQSRGQVTLPCDFPSQQFQSYKHCSPGTKADHLCVSEFRKMKV